MASKAWKDFEREVATAFGGKRRIRISYSESCEDIIHPTLAIECKYGLQVPLASVVNDPTDRDSFVLIPSEKLNYLERQVGMDGFYPVAGKSGRIFFRLGLEQARMYASDKTPLLCMKRPRQRGFTAVMHKSDYLEFIQRPRSWTLPTASSELPK